MSKYSKGNVNYTVFIPSKEPSSMTDLRDCIKRFSFKPLLPEDVRDESVGWVDPFLCFDNENYNNLLFRDALLFFIEN